jgi:hypothetical protein
MLGNVVILLGYIIRLKDISTVAATIAYSPDRRRRDHPMHDDSPGEGKARIIMDVQGKRAGSGCTLEKETYQGGRTDVIGPTPTPDSPSTYWVQALTQRYYAVRLPVPGAFRIWEATRDHDSRRVFPTSYLTPSQRGSRRGGAERRDSPRGQCDGSLLLV